MNEHSVLYVVESMVVLKSMLPAMLETRRQNISVDVYVYDFGEEHHYYHLLKDVADYIAGLGFDVFRVMPEDRIYDAVYSAYPGHYQELTAKNQIKYHIRFTYHLAGAHIPIAVYSQGLYNYYDFIVCLGEPDAKIMSGHAKTVSIGNIKLSDYKRTRVKPEGKKTVLYLPTWGADNRVSSVNSGVIEKLIELQCKYRIIAKMHSAMQHFEHQHMYRELFGVLDNIYDTNTPIADLLNEADVVLSDISSVAFDAVAGDVPLALFGLGDPIYLDGKLCLHQQLVRDDIIPGTNDLNELETVIEKALTPEYFAKAQKLKKELFLYEGRECVNAFMRFQSDLFEDRVDPWYIATRRAIRENYIKECLETQGKMDTATQELAQKKTELSQTQEVLTQTQGAMNQALSELAQTQDERDITLRELTRTRRELDQTRGDLAKTREELDGAWRERANAQEELTILQDGYAQLASQITAIENTKVWRYTKSFRKLYGLMVRK